MSDRNIRYNREFLNWDKTKFNNDSKEYRPFYHVSPSIGLINDPNCVFYLNDTLYIFFQHHPANQLHGLKTMSLAKTKDFVNYEYNYMINKPENSFESHGVYSGNAIVYNNKVFCIYTGNQRDENWDRTSNIVLAEFNVLNESFENKKVILNNKQFSEYTEHFRDPYIFEYNNKFYFLLGAQNKNNDGKILIFSIDLDTLESNLISEISFPNKYKMIECPNVVVKNNKALLIYSPQFKDGINSNDINPDVVRYSIVDIDELFNGCLVNEEHILDYGYEYYAPQTFSINEKWYVIAWVGIPTSNNFIEKDNGWIHTLSSIREITFNNEDVVLNELESFKNELIKNHKENYVFYNEVKIKNNDSISIKGENDFLSINFKNKNLIFVRNSKYRYNQYSSIKKIPLNINDCKLELFYDNSSLEIKINDKIWFTCRLYLGKDFELRVNNEK